MQARKLPKGFTEGMIMRHPSRNIMNELARGVLLALLLRPGSRQHLHRKPAACSPCELIGSFPSIVANAYAVKRHYFDGESLHIHYPERGALHGGELPAHDPPGQELHRGGGTSARYDADDPRRARRRQQLHLCLPRDVLERHGYLQRHRGRGRLAEGPAARRRERQGHADVPLHQGKCRPERRRRHPRLPQ